MGRRKIEIQPLTDERNRTVTFIKRKAGLLKKAHELAVLCQVDITVLIVGPNNTLYEFSSVDTNDLIDHYINDKSMTREVKDPSDFGSYTKRKSLISENLINSDSSNDHISKKRRLSIDNHNHSYLSHDSDENDTNDSNEEDDDTGNSTIHNNNNNKTNNNTSNKNLKSLKLNKTTTRLRNQTNHDSNQSKHSSKSFQKLRDRDLKDLKVKSETIIFNNPLQDQIQKQIEGFRTFSSATNSSIRSSSHTDLNASAISGPSMLNLTDESQHNQNKIKQENHANSLSLSNEQRTNLTTTRNTSIASNQDIDKTKKSTMRPVLRVEIPNNNIISNDSIQSEPSSTTLTNIYSNNGSSQYFRKSNNNNGKSIGNNNIKTDSPLSATSNGALTLDKRGDISKFGLKAPTNTTFSFSNGLPPLFSSTSTVPPYIATPLQGTNNNNSLAFSSNNSSSPIQAQMLPNQRQSPINQSQRYNQHITLNPPQINSNRILSPTGGLTKIGVQDHMMNGPTTGSLPSKFANDLMMPSPSGSMSMFQDWGLASNNNNGNNHHTNNTGNPNGLPSGANSISRYNNTGGNSAFPHSGNGNTGLTPYINVGQTPLANKFFNFSNDVGGLNDDSTANNAVKELKEED